MQIDESDEQFENAELSMDESRETESNVTVDRKAHPEKQLSQICVTDEGIQIDERDSHFANAQLSRHES
jgi:hypothetical protein